MITHSCRKPWAESPCDGIADCADENFDTQTEYDECVGNAQEVINTCVNACSDDLITAEDAASSAASDCGDGCDAIFEAAARACADAETDCEAGCDDDYTACTETCTGDDIDACLDDCLTVHDDCDADCTTAFNGCMRGPTLDHSQCGWDCDKIAQDALAQAEEDFQDCSRSCCSSTEGHPDPCHHDCTRDWLGCQSDVTDQVFDCQRECFTFSVDAQFADNDTDRRDSEKAYTDCNLECVASFADDQADCLTTLAECDRDCTVVDMKNQLWCSFWENRCYTECEKTYEEDSSGCISDHTGAINSCNEDDINCTTDCDNGHTDCVNNDCGLPGDPGYAECIEGCLSDYSDCLDTCSETQDTCTSDADDALHGCLPPFVDDRYDCRLGCCTGVHGDDDATDCYAECWGTANCDSGDEDCTDALNDCLFACPGAYGDTTPILPTCNPCGARAAQAFLFF